MKIKQFTKYRTRGGAIAEIYRVDVHTGIMSNATFVLGCIVAEKQRFMLTWDLQGKRLIEDIPDEYDLIENMGPVLWSIDNAGE